jgi:cytidylate kinase
MNETSDYKRIITIAGQPGSGKSSTAKEVARRLGYQHFSSGDLFRALAREQGHDVLQANSSAEQNAAIDNLVDGRLKQMGQDEDQLVVDSRLAWHWMPQSFKVFLDLDLGVAAQRILANIDEARLKSENIPSDPAAYTSVLQERMASESRRYKTLYDVDLHDKANYSLVIDTAVHDLNAVVELVLQDYHNHLAQHGLTEPTLS